MSKREAEEPDGVAGDPESASASLLDRWQDHQAEVRAERASEPADAPGPAGATGSADDLDPLTSPFEAVVARKAPAPAPAPATSPYDSVAASILASIAATDPSPGPDEEPEPVSVSEVGEHEAAAEPEEPAAAEPEEDSGAPEASVSMLDEVRARREGPPEVEPPLVEPTPIRAGLGEPPPEPDPVAPARHADAVRRPKHVAARRPMLPAERATDSVAASREVMDALSDEPAEEVAPAPDAAAEEEVRPGRRSRSGPEVGPSLNVDFAPKLAARRVVGLLLLVGLAVTAGAAYVALDDPRPLTLGVAGTLLAVTLMLYAVRAGSSPTYLAIRSGQLEVRRGKALDKFDLTSRFTRIEVIGKPGRPGWKVLLGRFGRDPLVISASIVDPKQFSAELERYRPSS